MEAVDRGKEGIDRAVASVSIARVHRDEYRMLKTDERFKNGQDRVHRPRTR